MSTTTMTNSSQSRTKSHNEIGICRIAVIGSHPSRLQKIVSLLRHEADLSPNNNDNPSAEPALAVPVEYLPCVAKFDSYVDETTMQRPTQLIRYLVSVQYYNPNDGKLTSLLPYLDEEGGDASNGRLFVGVAGIAIGSGIDDADDVARIKEYFLTVTSNRPSFIPVECIKPNEGFTDMKQEMEAFKALDEQSMVEAVRSRRMGPGKMAKFVADFTARVIREKTVDSTKRQQPEETLLVVPTTSDRDGQEQDHWELIGRLDPDLNRFSCWKCRTMLFAQNHLEDPPHEPSLHSFSHRKHALSGRFSTQEVCQSYFLREGLEWMGDMSETEGRIHCPTCRVKLGAWHWSGTQCSCGTWVVPAIQIPRSKVDLVTPLSPTLPVGTVTTGVPHTMMISPPTW